MPFNAPQSEYLSSKRRRGIDGRKIHGILTMTSA